MEHQNESTEPISFWKEMGPIQALVAITALGALAALVAMVMSLIQ